MNPHLSPLFVILVHYGDPTVTTRSLTALSHSTAPATGVIVIDQDPTPYVLPTSIKATVIRPTTNNGYGAAVNIGLGAILSPAEASDLVVVMNNDVLVEPDTLDLLRQQRITKEALMGVSIWEGGQKLSGGGLRSVWSGRTTLQSYNDKRKPDYIHGAFLVATYKVWLKLQCMPEQYFLYWEDVLLSERAKRKKVPLYLMNNISVQHESHDSASPSPQKTYYLVRNGAYFMEQETGWLIRTVWRLRNRLRLVWHKWRNGSESVVYRALLDMKNGVKGKVEI